VGTLDNEFVKFGRTVAEVMKHYGAAPDMELNANVGFVLLDKEEREGLAALSRGERFVSAVQGMIREVNNGGWDQFFRNSSGALGFDLVPALEAIGSKENLFIAQRALERFGRPASLSEDDRWSHLEAVRGDDDDNPWEDLDDEFYETAEDLEAMTLRYIASHPAEFPA
jgi:hypothetical protein